MRSVCRRFNHLSDLLGATIQATFASLNVETELGRDLHLVADWRNRLADELLVGVRAVHLCRVEERHAHCRAPCGTATITRCVRDNGHYCWHLSDVKRLPKPHKPKGRPQPEWFNSS